MYVRVPNDRSFGESALEDPFIGTPGEPVLAPVPVGPPFQPRPCEILSLQLRYSGPSEVERVGGAVSRWYRGLEDLYRWVGVGKNLGYQGRKVVEKGLVWNTEHASGLFAFELVAEYVVPQDRTLPVWKSFVSNVLVKDSAGRIIREQKTEIPDGPSGVMFDQTSVFPGDFNRIYAYDAPRLSPKFGLQKTYSLTGDWRVVVKSKINSWQVRFRLAFSFSDTAPEKGTGSVVVLEAPHRL